MTEISPIESITAENRIPIRIEVPKIVIIRGQKTLTSWNLLFLGFVPYCSVCKIPVNLVRDEGDVIFRCPQCNREWVKDNDWLMQEALSKGG